MDWGDPITIIAFLAFFYVCWLGNNWIRARHGYPLEDEWGGKSEQADPAAARKVELLTNENETMKGQITRLEDRLSVLERIATDKSARLSAEIEDLREEAGR